MLFFAAYDFIRSRANGLSYVSPLKALILILAMQTITTTSVFANILLMFGSLLISFVQFVITGARATIGIALNAPTIVRPPLPYF